MTEHQDHVIPDGDKPSGSAAVWGCGISILVLLAIAMYIIWRVAGCLTC